MNRNAGPAFPFDEKNDDGSHHHSHDGMSLRDWFAGQVAAGMAAFSGTAGVSYGPGEIAGRSYEVADSMLKAREA